MVPFIDLCRFEDGFMERWLKVVTTLSQRANFIGGDVIEELETTLSNKAGVEYAITCSNGTDAIQLALRSCGVETGDIVLVPDLTFWATFEAVVNVGARPVTVDICQNDGGFNLNALHEAVEMYTPKAVVAAHLYGWGSCQLAEIRKLCQQNGVVLVEDGAQCFGTNLNSAPIYSEATISTTSFYPAKVLGAAGDAGAVFTNNEKLARKVRSLSNHGRSAHYAYEYVGWNARMDTFQAAYLLNALEYLEVRLKSRRSSAHFYQKKIDNNKIKVLTPPAKYQENGYCNVLLIDDLAYKADLETELRNNQIGFANIYPGAISEQPGASRFLAAHVGGDNAKQFCSKVLNLPLFPYLRKRELEEVVQVVNSFGDEAK